MKAKSTKQKTSYNHRKHGWRADWEGDRQVVDRKMDGGLGNDGEAERSFLKFGNS
jgi:hypothetical protein